MDNPFGGLDRSAEIGRRGRWTKSARAGIIAAMTFFVHIMIAAIIGRISHPA